MRKFVSDLHSPLSRSLTGVGWVFNIVGIILIICAAGAIDTKSNTDILLFISFFIIVGYTALLLSLGDPFSREDDTW